MKDSWQSGDPYEYYMGRWSRLVADSFVQWLSPKQSQRWLDVGCGSGALSEAVIKRCNPTSLIAIDQSAGFVNTAQARLGNKASCRVGDALALPVEDTSVDVAVSGLVLNFIPDPAKVIAEMRRVTAAGGVVALYIWDYARMDFLNRFWDIAVQLNPAAAQLNERDRFANSNADQLSALFNAAGFTNIETTSIKITTHFTDFDDFWQPFLGGQGPAPTYVVKLEQSQRDLLHNTLKEHFTAQQDGSMPMAARAWAVKAVN